MIGILLLGFVVYLIVDFSRVRDGFVSFINWVSSPITSVLKQPGTRNFLTHSHLYLRNSIIRARTTLDYWCGSGYRSCT